MLQKRGLRIYIEELRTLKTEKLEYHVKFYKKMKHLFEKLFNFKTTIK